MKDGVWVFRRGFWVQMLNIKKNTSDGSSATARSRSKSRNDRQFARKFAVESDMNRELEFLFDYGSPFSYLANLQIEGFAKRNGTGVTYTPILLGAVLQASGNALPMTVPAHIHAPLPLALPVPREGRTV